jgi:cob(I)alamin adenosyltransferase
MKLYTKKGDAGRTQLFGGQEVDKNALRVEAYGSVDELNAVVGHAAAACVAVHAQVRVILVSLQSRLFELGADLASPLPPGIDPAELGDIIPRIGSSQVSEAEAWIDATCAPLPPMRFFILPGGGELSARLHLARTVCRRAERVCVSLAQREPVGPQVIIYLNRLSDLFFALARRANQLDGIDDVPWTPR